MSVPFPSGFVLYTQWPEYVADPDIPDFLTPTFVGRLGRGVRRGVWPLYVESYAGDEEPVDAEFERIPKASARIVSWQRFRRTDIPRGWYSSTLLDALVGSKYRYAEGYARLEANDGHFQRWDPAERTRRRRWLRDLRGKCYEVTLASVGEFWNAYRGSSTWPKIDRMYAILLKRKLERDAGKDIDKLVVRRKDTGEIVAGLAALNSPLHTASYYIVGFLCEAGKKDNAMTALMTEWFTRSYERGYSNVQLGKFWDVGSPEEWKGFSNFKAKFGVEYIHLPPLLYRFI